MIQDAILYMMVGYATFVCIPDARYWFNRQEGWKMFFATILVGCLGWHGLNFAGSVIAGWFGVPETFSDSVPFQITMVVLGILVLGILALATDNLSAAKRVATACGDLTELLLQAAIENRYNVELTMRSGKVYIGRPLRSGVTTSPDSDISLIPIMSGRRNKIMRLKITTFYTDALRKFAGEGSRRLRKEDFQVILPKDEILSAKRFDMEVYAKSFKNKKAPH